MATFLRCITAFVRPTISCNKFRLRSWRSLVVSFGIFPSDHITPLNLITEIVHRYRHNPSFHNDDNRIRHALHMLIKLRTINLEIPHHCNVHHNVPHHKPYFLPPQLVPYESWEVSLARLLIRAIECLWPAPNVLPQQGKPIPLNTGQDKRSNSLHPYAHLCRNIIFWNIRTLRITHSSTFEKRLRVLSKWIAEKNIICLSETHLAFNEHLELEQCLQARVLSSVVQAEVNHSQRDVGCPTRPAPPEKSVVPRKAGICVILHRSIEPSLIHWDVLVPGYALIIVFQGCAGSSAPWSNPFIIIAVYIDPARKGPILQHIRSSLQEWKIKHPQYAQLPVLTGGDFNISAAGTPRTGYRDSDNVDNDKFNDDICDIETLFNMQEVFAQPVVPTWRALRSADSHTGYGRHKQEATLDRIFASATGRNQVSVKVLSCFDHLLMSDHSPIEVSLQSSPRSASNQWQRVLSSAIPASIFTGNSSLLRILRLRLYHVCLKQGYATLADFGVDIRIDDPHHCEIRTQEAILLSKTKHVTTSNDVAPAEVLATCNSVIRGWFAWSQTHRHYHTSLTFRKVLGLISRARLAIDAAIDGAFICIKHAQILAAMRAFAETTQYRDMSLASVNAVKRVLIQHPGDAIKASNAIIEWSLYIDNLEQDEDSCMPEGGIHEGDQGKPKPKTAWQNLAAKTFPKFVKSPPITDDVYGLPFSSPEFEEKALRSNRETLWTQLDAINSPLQKQWLDAYRDGFVGNKKLLCDIPSLELILNVILRTKKYAPGLDGIPYEAWKIAPLPIARVIHNLFKNFASHPGEEPLHWISSVDLNVFIPKAAGLTSASAQRPLSIPSTLLRLVSAIGMEQIGQQWASHLHQAATALKGKGDCTANVRKLQDFVDWFHVQPTYRQTNTLCSAHSLLPPVLGGLLTQFHEFTHALSISRSLAFVDQVKAYEVIAHSWLIGCWDCITISPWIWQWLHLVVLNRKVRIRVKGHLGPILALVKGLGMGGPHAPHMWAVGFDPIVWILDAVVGTYLTTVYADDTSLANAHNEQLLIGQVFLLCANATAGLQVAHHHCLAASFDIILNPKYVENEIATIVKTIWETLQLPLIIKQLNVKDKGHGIINVQFNTSSSVLACLLVRNAIQLNNIIITAEPTFQFNRILPCTCSCKCDLILAPLSCSHRNDILQTIDTLIHRQQIKQPPSYAVVKLLQQQSPLSFQKGNETPVPISDWLHLINLLRYTSSCGDPASDLGALAEAEISLWGNQTLTRSARYLGPVIAGPMSGSLGLEESLKKPCEKIAMRIRTSAAIRSSWNGAVYMWNVHILSCSFHIFAAHFANRAALKTMHTFARSALRTGNWCTVDMMCAISGTLLIKGFPTCPHASAIACYCIAGLRAHHAGQNPNSATYGRAFDLDSLDNPLGLRISSYHASCNILNMMLAPLGEHSCTCPRILNLHACLVNLLSLEVEKANCGQPRFPQMRRLIYRIHLLRSSVDTKGGYCLLIARSRSRTFGRTIGEEWEALSKFGHLLSPLIAYDFTRCWLNGLKDDRRCRWGRAPITCESSDVQSEPTVQAGSTGATSLSRCTRCGLLPIVRFLPHGLTNGRLICQECAHVLATAVAVLSPTPPPLWKLFQVADNSTLLQCIQALGDTSPNSRTIIKLTEPSSTSGFQKSVTSAKISDPAIFHCRLCNKAEFSAEHILWWCPVVFNGLECILQTRVEPLLSNPLFLTGIPPLLIHAVGLWLRTCLLSISNKRNSPARELIALGLTPKRNLSECLRQWWKNLPAKWRPLVCPISILTIIQEGNCETKLRPSHPSNKVRAQCAYADKFREACCSCQTRKYTSQASTASPTMLHPELINRQVIAASSLVRAQSLIAFSCGQENPIMWPLIGRYNLALLSLRHTTCSQQPNAFLSLIECECGSQGLALKARFDIEPCEEILISHSSPLWALTPSKHYISVMFDGSCPQPRAVSPSAGAGIVVLYHEPDGTTKSITTIRASIPGKANAQIAEALGARIAALLASTSGKRLCQQHSAEYVLIRGDSRVIAMDLNGYGTVTSSTMSALLAPIKFWLQQCPCFHSFQHVSRAFNSLADKAANDAANLANLLVSAPSLSAIMCIRHSNICHAHEEHIRCAIFIRNKHLIQSARRNGGKLSLGNLALICIGINARTGSENISNVKTLIDAIEFGNKDTGHDTSTTSVSIVGLIHTAVLNTPASLLNYLTSSAIPEEHCARLIFFFQSCLCQSALRLKFFKKNDDAALGMTQASNVLLPLVQANLTRVPSLDKHLVAIHALEVDEAARPLGLPGNLGEFDEFVWAYAFAHIDNAYVHNFALNLCVCVLILLSDCGAISPETHDSALCALREIKLYTSEPIRINARISIISRKIKLAIIGQIECFLSNSVPAHIESAINVLVRIFQRASFINTQLIVRHICKNTSVSSADNTYANRQSVNLQIIAKFVHSHFLQHLLTHAPDQGLQVHFAVGTFIVTAHKTASSPEASHDCFNGVLSRVIQLTRKSTSTDIKVVPFTSVLVCNYIDDNCLLPNAFELGISSLCSDIIAPRELALWDSPHRNHNFNARKSLIQKELRSLFYAHREFFKIIDIHDNLEHLETTHEHRTPTPPFMQHNRKRNIDLAAAFEAADISSKRTRSS